MKNRRFTAVIGMVFLIASAIFVIGCDDDSESDEAAEEQADEGFELAEDGPTQCEVMCEAVGDCSEDEDVDECMDVCLARYDIPEDAGDAGEECRVAHMAFDACKAAIEDCETLVDVHNGQVTTCRDESLGMVEACR